MKWVTAMRREKWLAKKLNNAQIYSSHFATDEPSQFSKGKIFPTDSSFC